MKKLQSHGRKPHAIWVKLSPSGRGFIPTLTTINEPANWLLVTLLALKTEAHVPRLDANRSTTSVRPSRMVRSLTGVPFGTWDEMGGPVGAFGNDLEPAALAVVPELARWRDLLGDATGQRPRLAGSGSTWFVDGDHAAAAAGVQVVHTVGPDAG